MAIVTSIIGSSGSGKSTSMEEIIQRKDAIVIRPSKKPFPWKNTPELRKKITKWDKEKKTGSYIFSDDSNFMIGAMKLMTETYDKKIIIIEDSTFVMTNYFMATALETGFTKFTQNALNYFNIIKAAEELDEDVRVYLINHIEEDANGFKKVKTIGKMLDEKIDIPSLLTIVLEARVVDGKHMFITNKKSSMDIAKSPKDMFTEEAIPNDLLKVDEAIRDYYGIE